MMKTDLVEQVAGDLWSTLYSGNNTQHDVKQAVGNALEAAGVPALQAMAEELEHARDALRAIIATNDEDWDCEDLREIARAALAEGCPLLTPEEEAELVERINANPNLHPTPGGPHE